MSDAGSTLEALLVNDTEHPAIRHFILITKAILESKNLPGKEQAAIVCIKEEMIALEKRLRTG